MVDLIIRRAARFGTCVEIIYLDRRGVITRRRIRVRSADESGVEAFCFLRRAPRRFERSRILAAR